MINRYGCGIIVYERSFYGDIFDKAIVFATKAHSSGLRKGTNIPYATHPMEVVAIVVTMTDDKDILATAILHDTVEDTEKAIDDIRGGFGKKVARLVATESENKRDNLLPEATWKIRK